MGKAFSTIDQWFNGTPHLTRKTSGFAGGSSKRGIRQQGKRHANANNNIKNSMKAIVHSTRAKQAKASGGHHSGAKKLPQVMIKITGGGRGADKAQANINYIGREGELTVYDQDGLEYKGLDQRELMETWRAMGMPEKDEDGQVIESYNIIFSMPKGTDPDKLREVVKDLVEQEFSGHKYFMAQHLDTDSPHCHVLLASCDDRGARLEIKKEDLHNYRVAFVNKLAERGISAVTSHRIHHYEEKDSTPQKLYHLNKDGKSYYNRPNKSPTMEQQQKINQSFARVTRAYEAVLEDPDTPPDIKPYIEEMLAVRKSLDNSHREIVTPPPQTLSKLAKPEIVTTPPVSQFSEKDAETIKAINKRNKKARQKTAPTAPIPPHGERLSPLARETTSEPLKPNDEALTNHQGVTVKVAKAKQQEDDLVIGKTRGK